MIRLVLGDITNQTVDAIVNAANQGLLGGEGVDGAIHKAGGKAILRACESIRLNEYPNGLPRGSAVITPAGDLPAHCVIHTVGPVWYDGKDREPEVLAHCYKNSLDLAKKHNIHSIAFPSISTGAYNYPVKKAAVVALAAITSWVESNPDYEMDIRMVLYGPKTFAAYEKVFISK